MNDHRRDLVKRARDHARRSAAAIGLAVAVTVASALGLAGCGPAHFNSVDITGAQYAKELSLADPSGKVRTLADFKGKVVTVFFGFTHCPEVCPTAMAKMAEVMKLLGPDAARVQVLFVTLDPERDTPELLAQYVPAFDPTFIGLRGDAAATAEAAKQFKVFYQKVPGTTPDTYSIDHTAFTYVYDPQGRVRLVVKHDAAPEKIAEDIRTLLGGA